MGDEAMRGDDIHQDSMFSYLSPEAVLQVLYTIRSERLFMEQLDYNLLFRWFVGLSMDDPVWDHSTFSKNRKGWLESKQSPNFSGE